MYINPNTLSNQSNPAPGLLLLTVEQEALYLQYNGFIKITSTDPVTIEADTEAWEAWKATQPDPLDAIKAEKIAQSKTDLAAYLKAHPMQWTDGNYYSITQEKQNQLTSKLAVAQAKATMGVSYDLKWNTTEEVCVPWEISDLYALAFAIDARVTALVTYQQTQEVAIRNATTKEELDGIVVDYATV